MALFAPLMQGLPSFRQLPGQSGRPAATPQAAQPAKVNQPAAPTMALKPVGRPPGQPGTNGWRSALASGAAKLAASGVKTAAGNPAAASGMVQKTMGTGANRNPDLVKAATGFLKAGADLTAPQREAMAKTLAGTDAPPPGGTVSLPPGVTPQAPAPAPNQRSQAPAPGPASTPAPNAPAPAAGAQPVAASGTPQPGAAVAAPSIATPATAASQPLSDSPWEYEKKWGALAALGDQGLDASVKQSILDQMANSPFDASARARESGRLFEEGMVGQQAEVDRLKADLARRGITGQDAARIIAESNTAARANISNQQRTSLLEMSKEEATHKLNATAQGQQVAAELAQRGVDIETLRMNREQLAQQLKAAKHRGGGGGGGEQMLEIMNPDGSMTQVPMNMVGLALDLMEGGYE